MDKLTVVRSVLNKHKKDLLKKAGVTAVGIGFKVVSGEKTVIPSIVVSVEKKKSKSEISKSDLIPEVLTLGKGILKGILGKSILTAYTDVVETGKIRALHTGRHRPAPGGVSIGHEAITAGTLGCVVKQGTEIFILSNSHVLACSGAAQIGDNILQPGTYDSGKFPEDHMAELTAFVPIEMSGSGIPSECPVAKFVGGVPNLFSKLLRSKTKLMAIKAKAAPNLVDAAIARPLSIGDVDSEIMEIGAIADVQEAELGMAIKKSGRTTGLTTGVIEQVDVTCQVQYGEGQIAVFEDQLMAGAMCAGGDSGSAVLTEDNHLVGLLFAGSETTTVINRIQNVFELLKITL